MTKAKHSDSTKTLLSRRQLLSAIPAAAAAPLVIGTGGCAGDPPQRPEGVPLSNFTRDNTAEDVTEGLDLTGKLALVTGCNSGIGYETMRVLAMRGAHVLGAARTLAKATDACASVTGQTTPLVVELTDFENIARGTAQVAAMNQPLDILICNAGIMELPELEQVNGIEKQFYVNHLGHFVLVNRLLPQLLAAPQGRIVNVSSGRATGNPPDEGIQFDNLSGEQGYDPGKAYGQSKLANVLFTLELARRLEGTTVTANALRPGAIPTNLGRHMPKWKNVVFETVGSFFTSTIPEGAATQVYLATAPSLSETSGYFFERCNPIRAGGYTEDSDMAKQLWDVSAELTAGHI